MKNNSDVDDNHLVGILQEEDPEPQLVLPHPPGVARLLGRQIVLPGDKVCHWTMFTLCNNHSPPSLPIFIISGSGWWGREAVDWQRPGHGQGRHGDQTLKMKLTNEKTVFRSRDLY